MKKLQLRNNPAYNEGNLLGHQVTDGVYGAVPLTFTRNSNGYILDTNGDKLRGANVPRIKSDGSVLLEPARTNLLTYSQEFDNASWTKVNATISANASTAPDGTMTADKLVETSTLNFHYAQYSGISYSGNETISIYAKAGERNCVAIGNSSSGASVFNLTSGTLISSGGVNITDEKIKSVGNGWYRLSAKITTSGTYATQVFLSEPNGNKNYLGDGTSGLYIWGAQLEAGSYPTSYIPTTTATVTRVAESVSKTGIANLIGQSEGTIFFESSVPSSIGVAYAISLSDGTNNNRVYFAFSNNQYQMVVVSGGASQVAETVGAYTSNQNCKIALKYKENDFALWVNGVEVATDTSGLTFSGTTLSRFAFDSGAGFSTFYGNVKQLALYTTALNDTELLNLTK